MRPPESQADSETGALCGRERPRAAMTPRDGRGRALIVDDEAINRLLLSSMLRREGFQTLEADHGQGALSLFERERPDIVFMDAMMPGMDGFETTQRIKAMAGMEFVPVIFLTALQDDESQMRCTQAGGDDFLTKPFNFTVLKARILAMERVRDLQRAIIAKNQLLAERLERERQEQELAERVFSHAINNLNVAIDRLGLIQRPAALFSGDLLVTQHLPDGGLRLLLGDFTGHGLAAAIGAMPIVEAFHAMTRKGVDDRDLLSQLNCKLYQLLPADRFMAACLITIPGQGRELRWWNGGMPSAWLRTREGLREFVSHALPLGILPELPDDNPPRRVELRAGDGLLMLTDGLVEARNRDGMMFENAGFGRVLDHWRHGQRVLPALNDALDAHCQDAEQSDDISVLEIPLDSTLFIQPCSVHESARGGWSWSLELRDRHLGNLRSVESLLRPLGLLDGLDPHLGALETIVAELYSNALEHGILNLSSSMKITQEGFDAYYRRRSECLESGIQGRIGVDISYELLPEGGCLKVRIADSGHGFDDDHWQGAHVDPARPWGRGIALVRDLCESLTYFEEGRLVEAVYRC